MLLQKTSSRIKQFICHRRNSSIETLGNDDDDGITDTKLATLVPKRSTWLSSTSGPDSIQLRRTSSTTTTRSILLPPSITAHSSASSLCSCDCNGSPASTDFSLCRGPSLIQPEILYLPPLDSANESNDAKTWRLIFSEDSVAPPPPKKSKLRVRTSLNIPDRDVGLIEGLAMEADDDKTPTQSIKYMEKPDIGEMSDNVEQLIRETDEAFQAVGSALADAKAATQGWYDAKPPVTRFFSVSRNTQRPQTRSQSTLKTPMSRSISVKKKKRKPGLFNRPRKVPPAPTNTPARWTLTDVTTNMVDVFSRKIFRTEVDEMLTPSRMQELRKQLRIENERRQSVESTSSHGTDESTPTEPFHLESLLRARNPQSKDASNPPSPVLPPPRIPPKNENRPRKPPEHRKNDLVDPAAVRNGMVFADMAFPTPPAASRTTRKNSATRIVPALPTIPEAFPLTVDSNLRYVPPQVETLGTPSSPDYILLPSTPFTLTSPLFRHGPIRIDKVKEEKVSPADEGGLDWIAFQMAISGTISLELDTELEDDEREIEELVEWWESYGIELGKMEGQPVGWAPKKEEKGITAIEGLKRRQGVVRRERVNSQFRAQALKRSWNGGMGGETIPHMPVWNHNSIPPFYDSHQAPNIKDDIDTNKVVVSPEDEGEATLGLCRMSMVRRVSQSESLPPSPMLDLGSGEEVIPMGYNLGHDLGDFLSWETWNVQTILER